MNFCQNKFDELHERLAALEKQNRRLKQLGVLGLIGGTLLLVLGQAGAKKTVEVNEFILKDGNGKVRAMLRQSVQPYKQRHFISDIGAVEGTGGTIDPNTGRILSTGDFGRIVGFSSSPRIIRLSLKLNF